MIYKASGFLPHLISYLIAFFLMSTYSNFSIYFSYVVSLNYWDSNLLCFTTILAALLTVRRYKILPAYTGLILLKTSFSWKVFLTVLFKKKLVNSLWVGTVLIHPLIFYTSSAFFFVYFYQLKVLDSLRTTPFRVVTLTSALCVALVLGGLWGMQSLTWGYVWVNDGIEWCLFLLILHTIVRYHLKLTDRRMLGALLTVYLIFNFLILIRLNVVTTRHSFFSNYNFVYLLSISLIYIIFLASYTPKVSNNFYALDFSSTILPLLLTLLLTVTNYTLVVKYLTYGVIFFYLSKINNRLLTQKFLLHFMVVSFVITWSAFYPYFFLTFKNGLSYTLLQVMTNMRAFHITQLSENYMWGRNLLEQVSFEVSNWVVNLTQLKALVMFSINFNNYTILLFVYVLFLVKRFELRLLYKKKTSL